MALSSEFRVWRLSSMFNGLGYKAFGFGFGSRVSGLRVKG